MRLLRGFPVDSSPLSISPRRTPTTPSRRKREASFGSSRLPSRRSPLCLVPQKRSRKVSPPSNQWSRAISRLGLVGSLKLLTTSLPTPLQHRLPLLVPTILAP